MEHWRFFVAILILLLLLRPVHEYFTENDVNILERRIDGVESRTVALNNMYDSDKILDISNTIVGFDTTLKTLTDIKIEQKIAELHTKLNLLGTVQTDSSPSFQSTNPPPISLPLTSSTNYVAFTFTLPVGTWLVTANIVYIPTQISSLTTVDPAIGVAINPLPNTNSIPDINSIEFPRTVGRYSRFSVSTTIKVTNASTNQTVSIYGGNGKVQVTMKSTRIGF